MMLLAIAGIVGAGGVGAGEPLCEWRGDGATIHDPCPEFWWPRQSQQAWRILVATKPGLLEPDRADLWASGWQESELNIAEYAGRPLPQGRWLWWQVHLRGPGGHRWRSRPMRFRFIPISLPHRLPHIRTYLNFGSRPKLIASRYDLTYRREAKQYNPRIITMNYSLVATCVVPSEKAEMLEQWCVERGLTKKGILEDMFLHYARDTRVTLHVGAERADRPRQTRTVPGWDPRNDRNGDGVVDEEEATRLANPHARARRRSEARVPIYYWPPPRADYVMNIGHPEYQAFMAERYMPSRVKGYDALYTDTTPATIPSRFGSEFVEYSGPDSNKKWCEDMQRLMAEVKRRMPETPWLANGWEAVPFVIDGTLRENWLNIALSAHEAEARIQRVREVDRRGKIQLVQYNPVYDPKHNEFGVKVAVSEDRDRIYGLAAYYIAAGDYTYFAIGQHPYVRAEDKWFAAIERDIGKPLGGPFVFYSYEPDQAPVGNLLANGGFELDADGDGKPDGWQLASPVEFVASPVHGGRRAAQIRSTNPAINNINKYYITLKPHTTYTLVAWMRTENVVGRPGAQVYPYEFEDAPVTGMITVVGTTPWRRYSMTFTTGDDATGRINFRMFQATGTAWFDDIAVFEGVHLPWRVMARRYERALVLLRPPVGGHGDDTAREFGLDMNYRRLHANGTLDQPANKVLLRGGEGAILCLE